jgi:hypothetical protein
MQTCESGLAVCPYCEDLVGDDAVTYGSERLHPACFEALGRDMEEADG